jgi:serine/threonine protein kinase
MDLDRLCIGCMGEKGETQICSLCGYDENQKISPLALTPRTILNQQYLIGRVLGAPGGFGVTYLAWDISLATPVAIKEYMPRALVARDPNRSTVLPHSQGDEELFRYGLEQFLDEARLLAQFDHLNIVRVRSFFEANATGYLVMDYYRGMNLAEYVKQNNKLLAKPALWVMMPILDGLREVHERGVLHRDIKPQNIYIIAERRRSILLDFGAARAAMQGRSQGLTAVLTEGFAPYENTIGTGSRDRGQTSTPVERRCITC